MRTAHEVDIVLLHHADVLFHEFLAHGTAASGMLVPVDSLDEDGRSVHAKLPVLDFYGAESHLAAGLFGDVPVPVFQCDEQCIEIRMFCAPCRYILYRLWGKVHRHVFLPAADRPLLCEHRPPFRISQHVTDRSLPGPFHTCRKVEAAPERSAVLSFHTC